MSQDCLNTVRTFVSTCVGIFVYVSEHLSLLVCTVVSMSVCIYLCFLYASLFDCLYGCLHVCLLVLSRPDSGLTVIIHMCGGCVLRKRVRVRQRRFLGYALPELSFNIKYDFIFSNKPSKLRLTCLPLLD